MIHNIINFFGVYNSANGKFPSQQTDRLLFKQIHIKPNKFHVNITHTTPQISIIYKISRISKFCSGIIFP